MKIIVEGFDPQPVPGQKEFLFSLIPKPESKHALKMVQTSFRPFFVGVDDNLGIGFASETMPFTFQRLTKLQEIIDFSVKNQLNRPLFIRHGLTALFGKVNDGQAAKSQSNPRSTENAFLIRPPVFYNLAQTLSQRAIRPVKS